MTDITITTDDQVVETLKLIAEKRSTTLEVVAREALSTYVSQHPVGKQRYSFIGIGNSGKGNLSQKVDETLTEGAHRREGWSLR